MFHNGTWGTVCDDFWDINNAQVVCRQLGFHEALSAPRRAHFGKGSGFIWLNKVQCVGTERTITDCQHNGWNNENCKHIKDASVICSRKLSKNFKMFSSYLSFYGYYKPQLFHGARTPLTA